MTPRGYQPPIRAGQRRHRGMATATKEMLFVGALALGALGIGVGAYALSNTSGAIITTPSTAVTTPAPTTSKKSGLQEEFRKEMGYDLKGHTDEIEGSRKEISNIVYDLQRQQQFNSYRPPVIRIASDNPARQTAKDLSHESASGYFVPPRLFSDGEIVLFHKTGKNSTAHEYTHGSIEELSNMSGNPFTREWRVAAGSPDGSIYQRNYVEEAKEYTEPTIQESRKQGFVTPGAKKNESEDAAQLSEWAMTIPNLVAEWTHGPTRIEPFARKIAVAQKYKLIPPEYAEYSDLHSLHTTIRADGGVTPEESLSFLRQSTTFLNQHPSSVFAGKVYTLRATALPTAAGRTYLVAAADEYRHALAVPFKEPIAYELALQGLTYVTSGNTKQGYEGALKEFQTRRDNADFQLTKRGVQDYLIAHKIGE